MPLKSQGHSPLSLAVATVLLAYVQNLDRDCPSHSPQLCDRSSLMDSSWLTWPPERRDEIRTLESEFRTIESLTGIDYRSAVRLLGGMHQTSALSTWLTVLVCSQIVWVCTSRGDTNSERAEASSRGEDLTTQVRDEAIHEPTEAGVNLVIYCTGGSRVSLVSAAGDDVTPSGSATEPIRFRCIEYGYT
jgi:hypothetical protein